MKKEHMKMYDKRRCFHCKYSCRYDNSDLLMCCYSIVTHNTAIYEEDGQIKDRRGGDLKDCKLYEPKDGKKSKYVYSIKKG
jgi:hypothetical protein